MSDDLDTFDTDPENTRGSSGEIPDRYVGEDGSARWAAKPEESKTPQWGNTRSFPRTVWVAGQYAPILEIELPEPTTIAVVCLPSPNGVAALYRLSYGTAGALRQSGDLPPGTYILGGGIVRVEARSPTAVPPVAVTFSAFAYHCFTAPTVP